MHYCQLIDSKWLAHALNSTNLPKTIPWNVQWMFNWQMAEKKNYGVKNPFDEKITGRYFVEHISSQSYVSAYRVAKWQINRV